MYHFANIKAFIRVRRLQDEKMGGSLSKAVLQRRKNRNLARFEMIIVAIVMMVFGWILCRKKTKAFGVIFVSSISAVFG